MALTTLETNIVLDVYDHDGTRPSIKSIALDDNTRYVFARLTYQGNTYDIGSTASVKLVIIRPDKVGAQVAGEAKEIQIGQEDESIITIYGAYAELDQPAIAVAGTLLGQFIITSGNQILRSQIFAVNNGEALDADEWAGQYDGYNLDELVAKVDNAVGKVDGMEADVTELKSGFDACVFDGKNVYNTLIFETNNTKATSNDDGTYTISPGDYGRCTFGVQTLLAPGCYKLFGVPQGMAFLSPTKSHNDAVFTNTDNDPKYIVIESETFLYLGYRIASSPASGFVITPFLYQTKIEDNKDDLNNAVVYLGPTKNTNYTDADDIDRNCSTFVSLVQGAPTIANVPYAAGWLDTYIINNSLRIQRITPFEAQKHPVMLRTKTFYGWDPWVVVSEKGYINAVDAASADETGKTDMRTAIQYALDNYGYCKLGTGTFYISGQISMPEGSTLEGSGESTELRLMSGNNKAAILIKRYSTVKDLTIIGSYADLVETDFGPSSGSRYGIQYYKGGSDTYSTAYCSIINVHIRNFSGAGIYQYGTGANVEQGLFVSNVHVKNCWCAIWIYANSEFCRYVNVQMTYCYIACINNGGNNAFDNCVFHAYSVGMEIDGTKSNSAHGMCSNSSFCHTGGNHGSALTLGEIANGFVFSGCQFWYNSVDINNCGGIVFSGCEFGRGTSSGGTTINIDGGNTIMFGNCVFMNDVSFPPDIAITNNSKVKFNGCYGSVSGNAISV